MHLRTPFSPVGSTIFLKRLLQWFLEELSNFKWYFKAYLIFLFSCNMPSKERRKQSESFSALENHFLAKKHALPFYQEPLRVCYVLKRFLKAKEPF